MADAPRSSKSGWHMEITETLYVSDRPAWRAWLGANYATALEIWLVCPKKASGRPYLPYNDSVEEALCFGWIDSIRKAFGDDATAQRYSPRRARSGYSQINIERLRRLREQGRLLTSVENEVEPILAADFLYPADIMAALEANPIAWANFQRYAPAYQRIRIAYIDHARSRPAEFEKRLANFLRKTEKDQQFGYNIEAYY